MPDYKLLGHNYTTPDLIAKVTGRAKYAEDYRADGMSFCKLLLSPMPHCRVRRIDASAALAMPGVKGILTADDLPAPPKGGRGSEASPSLAPEVALTNEPVYKGEPVLAVAAVSELAAAEAIENITLDLEPLPFVIDPLESLRPNGPNARREGNAFVGGKLKTVKWTLQDFAGGSRPRRHVPYTDDEPSAARNADRDGLLAEWKTLSPLLDAECDAHRRIRGAVGRHHTRADRGHQRIHRRWLRQQDSGHVYRRRASAAGEENWRSGDDAHQPRGRTLHRPPPSVVDGARQDRVPRRRPGHGSRHVHPAGRWPVRRSIRSRSGADDVLARLSADGDALPRHFRTDQHSAADIAAGARRRTDERHHGAAARQGGASAQDRCCRAPSHQRAVRQGAVRRRRQGRQSQPRHQRVRAAGDRSWSRALPVERTKGAQRQTERHESPGSGYLGQSVHWRVLERLRQSYADPS